MSIRVVIVEDLPMLRDHLRHVCTELVGFTVVGEADSYTTAVAVVREQRPDLVLLDLELAFEPDGRRSGFDVAAAIRTEMPGVRYAFVSGHCCGEAVRRTEASGCCGFLDKLNVHGDELVAALHALGEGRCYFSAEYCRLREQRWLCSDDGDKVLTDLERKVLALVGFALDDEVVGSCLQMAACTAADHRRRIRRKLGLKTREELMKYAMDRGITLFDQPNMPAPNCWVA